MPTEMNTETQLKQANAHIDALTRKSLAYIEATQPELDKIAAFNDAFEKRAGVAAAVLVERGIIAAEESGTLTTKLAADKLLALDLVVKLARMVGATAMGKAADVVPQKRKLDAFEALALTGDPTNTNPGSPLAVD